MGTMPEAGDHASMDRAHVLRPWTHFDSHAREKPFVVARGEGCRIWDAEGRGYIDAVGGLWCVNIGLGRREMAEAMAEQAERLAFSSTFVNMTNPPAAELAAKLAALAPEGLSRVHFTTGGSTAVDSAFRMAQFAQASMGRPGRRHVIARRHSYHGSTFASMSIGRRRGDRAPEFSYLERRVHHIHAPYLYRRPEGETEEGMTDRLVKEFEDKIDEVGEDNIAAFFAEPIQASGGVLVPPRDYLGRMKAVCEARGILFVADEVVCGFGRLGHWFASGDEYGVTPDIICCAKGITSGYQPLGAVIFHDRIWRAMAADKDRWYTSGFTYSGHPVACAAALKNIEIIEREGLLSRAVERGKLFMERLREISGLPLVGDVRGKGLMACLEFVADKETREPLPEEMDIGRRISDAAEARGVLVRPIAHLNVMSPALVISEDEIDRICSGLGEAVAEVADQLVRGGTRVA